jgi:3-deoxy-D-manno-octulosonic-acid transferase
VLTTTTSTAYKIAREKLSAVTVATGVFPLDFLPFSRAAWKRISPDLVVLTEGELWPEHLHRAKAAGVPSVLINARLSDRSYRRYGKVRRLAARLLGKLDRVLAGTESDLKRLRDLGVPPEKSSCSGNLKCDVDVGPATTEADRCALFAELFGETPAPGARPLVLLGSSTWPGDEELLISTYKEARATGLDLRLLIVPRHAERRAKIADILKNSGTTHYFRLKHGAAPEPSEICVADTTGELRRLSRAADLAFIGKSLAPNEGGQTPIECAMLGIPQVFGPAMSNFRDISRGLVECGAARSVEDEKGAIVALIALLCDCDKRAAMSARAGEWSARNSGATRRTLEALLGVLFSPNGKK